MTERFYLGNFELIVLLAVLRLEDEVYGVSIKRTLETGTEPEVSLVRLFAAPERPQTKGVVMSPGAPSLERMAREALSVLRADRSSLTERGHEASLPRRLDTRASGRG